MMSVALLLCLVAGAAGCEHDSDCSALHVCRHGDCEHKSPFPLAWQEYLGTVLIFCLLGMANASGLGGGVIMIPILMTIFLFPAHQTVALSLTMATVGAGTAYLAKIGARRPKSTKPLVDYDIAMLMQPGLLLGTVYGVMLNVVFPGWLLLVLLTLLLMYMCYTSFQK